MDIINISYTNQLIQQVEYALTTNQLSRPMLDNILKILRDRSIDEIPLVNTFIINNRTSIINNAYKIFNHLFSRILSTSEREQCILFINTLNDLSIIPILIKLIIKYDMSLFHLPIIVSLNRFNQADQLNVLQKFIFNLYLSCTEISYLSTRSFHIGQIDNKYNLFIRFPNIKHLSIHDMSDTTIYHTNFPNILAKVAPLTYDSASEIYFISLLRKHNIKNSTSNINQFIYGIFNYKNTIFIYYAMDKLHHTLYDIKQANISQNKLMNAYEQILSTLHQYHSINIIHGDIKPDNIMYNETTDEFILIDYDLCTFIQNDITVQYSSTDKMLNQAIIYASLGPYTYELCLRTFNLYYKKYRSKSITPNKQDMQQLIDLRNKTNLSFYYQ